MTFDDQFSKAVEGEASWKTSDFDRQPTATTSTSRQASAMSWSTPGAKGCQGPSGCWPRCCSPTSSGPPNEPPATGGGRSCSTAMTRGGRPAGRSAGGRLIKSAGDGILAVSDPGRGIRWALALRAELQGSGIEIGAGSTPARSTSAGDDVGGIAVHTAARTMAVAAGPGEVLVSRTVRNSHPQGPGGRHEKVTIAGRFSPDQRYCRLCASRILARSSLGRSTTRTSMPASWRAAAGHERGERKGAAACSSLKRRSRRGRRP